MAQIEESWQPIAETLGYRNEEEMLKHLYNEQGFSLSQIAKIVGYSVWSVRRRLVMAGVVMRNRGGANNQMGRKLAGVPDAEIFGGTYEAVAKKFGVHTASVYLERQRRKREGPIRSAETDNHSDEGRSGDQNESAQPRGSEPAEGAGDQTGGQSTDGSV